MEAQLAARDEADDELTETEPYEGVPPLTERDLQELDMRRRYA